MDGQSRLVVVVPGAGGRRAGRVRATSPLHPECVLRKSVASQLPSFFGGEASADLLTCEHPTSDSAFSSPETAESPEDSPSMLLLPCIPGRG